jgi:2-methylcitrate dehydratase PrpD
MDIERTLVECILDTRFDDLSEQAIEMGKNLLLTVLGTMIGGATAEGCEAVVEQVIEWGGRKEATILIHGYQVPAHNAAFVNSMMARALDYCDGMDRGMHLGSTCVPTALATAELTGGCSGKAFLTHLIVGAEAAARINSCSIYDGFDATGVCSILGAAAIAGRMLQLNGKQMLDALAIAFNRSGGSEQGAIDGAVALRVNQGVASQGGIISAQLAKKGITGPKNFLKGQWGYFHLFGDDQYNTEVLLGDWGKRFELGRLFFKRYPCCWCTTSSIDAILDLVRDRGLTPEDVSRIDITMTPRSYKMAGHPFEIGDIPRLDAQTSVRYCVASALVRKSLKLQHFEESTVRDPRIKEVVDRIDVTPDPNLEREGRFAANVHVTSKKGITYEKIVRSPRGGQGDPLSKEEHIEHFSNCFSYAGKPLPSENAEKILSMVSQLERLPDVCNLIPLLLTQN